MVHEVQRGRLLDALAEVMAEEGYLNTTVHKILKRAGISRRTFYELFSDKEACFLAAYEEAADHVLTLVQRGCATGDTPEARIANGLRAMLEFAEAEPKLARMCVVESMAAGEKARARRSRLMERIADLLATVLEERYPRHDALLRARLLTGGMHEIVYDSLARGDVAGISALADEITAAHLQAPGAARGR